MTNQNTATRDLGKAVGHAMALLSRGDAELARQQAEEILGHYPDEINCLFVVAAATRTQGNSKDALRQLQTLLKRAPDFALAHQELGFTYADLGQLMQAIKTLQDAVAIEPALAASWKLMGELFLVDGDEVSATEASNRYLLASSEQPGSNLSPEFIRAVKLFKTGKIQPAEQLCRAILTDDPTDVDTIRLLAEIGIKIGVFDDAQKLLERCLELAPGFQMARLNYATVLSKRENLAPALEQVDQLLANDPNKPSLLNLRASILVKMGDFDRALECYEYLLEHFPPRAMIALVYGHALKTVGKQAAAIAAYRQAISLQPGFGDAYWSMANLKTFRFTDEEIEAMRREVEKQTCNQEDYFHLCFALGKSHEDREEFEDSFHYYQLGNGMKVKLEAHDANKVSEDLHRIQTVCDSGLFSSSNGCGDPAPDPIFIVGLPRSGSTLLEQILASHSQVDGTKELVHIPAIVRTLGGKTKQSQASRYPQILKELRAEQLQELGQEYLNQSRIQRGSAAYFIDKMPNNFRHIGLIHLILPNARIIDARRHPMAACFSGFTQLFAAGQAFTYGLANIGQYYRDYVALMDHWDRVLPGKVLRVQYEQTVNDTETQVRRILDHCGLDFEPDCLNFHRSKRAVRTASSEQVRQPIYSGALEHWRNYEAFLDELKSSLGPVLDRYPV